MYRIYAGKKAIAEEKNGVVKFYHKDHLGSTRVVTDGTGKKIAEYKYAPYGEKETATGDGTDYGFTDKAEDESTGLQYFGARFYDPEVGRFLTQDPIKSGRNWYVYCLDNPLRLIDPNGLEEVESSTTENDDGTTTTTYTYGDLETKVTKDKEGKEISRSYIDNGKRVLDINTWKNGDKTTVESKTFYDKNGKPSKREDTKRGSKGNLISVTTFTWHTRTKEEAKWINGFGRVVVGLGLVRATKGLPDIAQYVISVPTSWWGTPDITKPGETYVDVHTTWYNYSPWY